MQRQAVESRAAFQPISVAGRNLVVDVATCQAFELDAIASEALQTLVNMPDQEVVEELCSRSPAMKKATREVEGLMSRGFFQPDKTSSVPPPLPLVARLRELNLALTYRCTLRCRYCYTDSEQELANRQVKPDMSEEVIDVTLKWASEHCAKGAEPLNIWAGAVGEALLRKDILSYLAARAWEYTNATGKTFSPAVYTTNLTLAGDPAAYDCLADTRFKWRVSIDGPKHIHDAMRKFPDGRGSYEIVARSAAQLVQLKPAEKLGAAATITGAHPHITEIFLHLYEMGFRNITLKPVRVNAEEPFAVNRQTLGGVKQGYSDFIEFLLRQDDQDLLEYLKTIWHQDDFFGRFILRVLGHGKMVYRCGAGKWAVGVDTNGDIYPCPPMIGLSQARIGSVFTGISEEAQRLYCEDLLITRKQMCKDCWARYFCGGGCYHAALLINERVDLPEACDCELTRHLIELAVYTAARLREEHPTVLDALTAHHRTSHSHS
ncbi:MAG: SPASM domain-containing protein [Armatimonadetes bacterium]|nr:SPASM domain-containing protein [Armatimonadota bacterium]NIM24187.1 SPASM domain-containing protein [Armatimonadota bacterium]NIM68052.1 SPASM domain-containing protein [Armatimonadota bacterium]NIM76086.1 SPASM domain-containing protein [Armatimonadota bacterium]NIN05757.1 SPASM domain-containing protein [Armatimonadota bacterium]